MTERIVTTIPEDEPEVQRWFLEENREEPPDIRSELASAADAKAAEAKAASPYSFIRGLVDVREKLPTAHGSKHGPQESRPLSSKRDLIVGSEYCWNQKTR